MKEEEKVREGTKALETHSRTPILSARSLAGVIVNADLDASRNSRVVVSTLTTACSFFVSTRFMLPAS